MGVLRPAADPAGGASAAQAPAITAVVPARNEAGRVGRTVGELLRHVDEVVVVDDASTDTTADEARAAGAIVLVNPARLGYIGSVRRAFAVASGTVVVTVDADGEMPVELISALAAPIAEGRADMVQGHRDVVPRVSERMLTRLARLGGPVGDSGSGFRAMRRELAAGLRIDGGCICGTLSLEALSKGARIVEIPIHSRTVDKPRRIAWGHGRQAVPILRLVARIWGARLRRRRDRSDR